MAETAFYGPLLARLHAEHYRSHSLAAAQRIAQLLGGREPEVVVDLGCGSGDLLAALASPGRSLIGVDRSPELLAYAAQRVPSASLQLGSIYEVVLPAEVDVLCAVGEVLQYGPDPRAGLEAVVWLCELAGERLRPGGLLAFDLVTPGRAGPSGRRVLEREEGGISVEVCAYEVGRQLERTITTSEGEHVEVEVHRQVSVTPGEALEAVTGAGLALELLAADYEGTDISELTSSVAVVARRP